MYGLIQDEGHGTENGGKAVEDGVATRGKTFRLDSDGTE